MATVLDASGVERPRRMPLASTWERLGPWLGDRLPALSVPRKLLLIYLLDLCGVALMCAIVVHEKYEQIRLADRERQGAAYLEQLRPTMRVIAQASAGEVAVPAMAHLQARAAHAAAGAGLDVDEHADNLASALQADAMPAADNPHDGRPLQAALALVRQIGNRAELILDPEIDSYYTMSLVVLRQPQLLETCSKLLAQLRHAMQPGATPDQARRLIAMEGELSAHMEALVSDLHQASTAGDERLRSRLSAAQQDLLGAVSDLHARSLATQSHASEAALPGLETVATRLFDSLDQMSQVGLQELTRLLEQRVRAQYRDMTRHLLVALAVLGMLLCVVVVVARRITVPLRRITGVITSIRQAGDRGTRLHWQGSDEIAQLIRAFNDMLDELHQQRATQQALAARAQVADAQFRLLQCTPVAMMVTALPDHEVLHVNLLGAQWLGGLAGDPWRAGLKPEAHRRFFQALDTDGHVEEFEAQWCTEQAHRWALISACRIDYQGRPAVLTTFTPIGRLKLAEQRLEVWAKVFEASAESIALLTADKTLVSANRAFCEASADAHGGPDLSAVLLHRRSMRDDDSVWTQAASRGCWRGELTIRNHAGHEHSVWAAITAVRSRTGELTHYIFNGADISDRKAAEESVRFLAHHDLLTGLANRNVAEQRVQAAMERAAQTGECMAVLFIDLDRFKNINDSLGHPFGDAVLQQVARRLTQAVRQKDTVSRFGGDEFVILLNGVSGQPEAVQIAERLLVALRLPITVDGMELSVSSSIGVAMFPSQAQSINELMRHADAAMYQAKATGRDQVSVFTDALNEQVQQRLLIEVQLRSAIARSELALVYQPQIDAQSGRLMAVEALLRWHSKELGNVPPAAFIPVAEESRLILPIGKWVIEQACQQMALWRANGTPVPAVAVNLSAVQLTDEGLLPALTESMARHDVGCGCLELELTESTLLESVADRLDRLDALKQCGVRLSIDDFGTGYSSLSYLSRLPMDKVKIDRSLVKDILSDPRDRSITEAVIALAHRLDMLVIAEGIESQEHMRHLQQHGCDAFQGFYIGYPMSPQALEAWIESGGHRIANQAPSHGLNVC